MAIFKAISCGPRSSLGRAIAYVLREVKADPSLCCGWGCLPETAADDMRSVQDDWGKTGGTSFYHYGISFPPGEGNERIVYEVLNELIGRSEIFSGRQIVAGVHHDRGHLHAHMIVNAVDMDTGRKFQFGPPQLRETKLLLNEICRERGLSIPVKGKTAQGKDREEPTAWDRKTYEVLREGERVADRNSLTSEADTREHQPSYIRAIGDAVVSAMTSSTNRVEFIASLDAAGIDCAWTDRRKHVTFTDRARAEAGEKKSKIRLSTLNDHYNLITVPEATEDVAVFLKTELEHEFERNAERSARDERAEDAAESGRAAVRESELDIRESEAARRAADVAVDRETASLDAAAQLERAAVSDPDTRRHIAENDARTPADDALQIEGPNAGANGGTRPRDARIIVRTDTGGNATDHIGRPDAAAAQTPAPTMAGRWAKHAAYEKRITEVQNGQGEHAWRPLDDLRRRARTVASRVADVVRSVARGIAEKIRGIGRDLSDKIRAHGFVSADMPELPDNAEAIERVRREVDSRIKEIRGSGDGRTRDAAARADHGARQNDRIPERDDLESAVRTITDSVGPEIRRARDVQPSARKRKGVVRTDERWLPDRLTTKAAASMRSQTKPAETQRSRTPGAPAARMRPSTYLEKAAIVREAQAALATVDVRDFMRRYGIEAQPKRIKVEGKRREVLRLNDGSDIVITANGTHWQYATKYGYRGGGTVLKLAVEYLPGYRITDGNWDEQVIRLARLECPEVVRHYDSRPMTADERWRAEHPPQAQSHERHTLRTHQAERPESEMTRPFAQNRDDGAR